MRILVTGAYGYIGTRLVRSFLADFHKVVAFGRQRNRCASAEATNFEGNVLEIERFDFGPLDAVVHLAGGGGPVEADNRPVEAVRTACVGAHRVGQYAQALGVKTLLMASSCYVYPPGDGLTEDTDTAPDTLYGAAKEAAELLWPGTSLRLAHIYGPSPVQLDSVVDRFVRAAASGGHLDVYPDGHRRLEYLHIDDLCTFFSRAVRATPEYLPTALNVGSGEAVSICELSDLCIEHGARSRYVYSPISDYAERRMDSSRAQRLFQWSANTSLRDGITRWIDALR